MVLLPFSQKLRDFETREADFHFAAMTYDMAVRVAVVIAVYPKSTTQGPDYSAHTYINIYIIYMLTRDPFRLRKLTV
jgi:hypothetical protein